MKGICGLFFAGKRGLGADLGNTVTRYHRAGYTRGPGPAPSFHRALLDTRPCARNDGTTHRATRLGKVPPARHGDPAA